MLPPADGPATSLEQLHLTLRLEPLIDKEEFARYYRSQVNDVTRRRCRGRAYAKASGGVWGAAVQSVHHGAPRRRQVDRSYAALDSHRGSLCRRAIKCGGRTESGEFQNIRRTALDVGPPRGAGRSYERNPSRRNNTCATALVERKSTHLNS